ncbi:MAG: amino acid ABC transporter substrate-binding protein [Desulfovibrio sp.]|nr:amino acid ABC transporter substrate-binding protein [Desulfovibrio sp.]MBI4958402.1 amino acid ABC transporter substrate-binding protein [Desulfovibrio sp.]
MPTRLLVLALLVLVCLPAPTSAEPVLVMVDTANPPFMFLTSEGKASGIYPAIITEAFERMKLPVKVSAVPWKRALATLEIGEAGVAGIYKTAERTEKFDFSEALFVEKVQVIVLANKLFPFLGIQSLKGKRLGVLRGWSYGDEFDKAKAEGLFIVEEVESDAQNLAKLKNDRLDAVLAIKESGEVGMSGFGSTRAFIALEPPLTEKPTYLAFSKQVNKSELLGAFNEALSSMRQDGTLDKIVMAISSSQ